MKELAIWNSNEKFTFFLDEDQRLCIRVSSIKNNKQKACIILCDEDIKDIDEFIKDKWKKQKV